MIVGERSCQAQMGRSLTLVLALGVVPLAFGCGRTSHNSNGEDSPSGGSTGGGGGQGAQTGSTAALPESDVIPLDDTESFEPTSDTLWYVGFTANDQLLGWPLDGGAPRAPRPLGDPSLRWQTGGVVFSPSSEFGAFHGSPYVGGTFASDIACRFFVIDLRGASPEPEEVCFAKEGIAREAIALEWVDERSLLVAFSASDGSDLQWFLHEYGGSSIKFVVDGVNASSVSPSPNGRQFAFAVQGTGEFYLMDRARPSEPLILSESGSRSEEFAWERAGKALSYLDAEGMLHLFDLRTGPTPIVPSELEGQVLVQAWGDSVLALATRPESSETERDTSERLHLFDLESGAWASFDLVAPMAPVQKLEWSPDDQALFIVGYRIPEGQVVIENPLFRFDAPFDRFADQIPSVVPLGLGDPESVIDLDWLDDGSTVLSSRLTFPSADAVIGVVRWPSGAGNGNYEILGDGLFETAWDFRVSPSRANLLVEGELFGTTATGQFWLQDGGLVALPALWPGGGVHWLPGESGFIVTRSNSHFWADLSAGVPEAWIDIDPE